MRVKISAKMKHSGSPRRRTCTRIRRDRDSMCAHLSGGVDGGILLTSGRFSAANFPG